MLCARHPEVYCSGSLRAWTTFFRQEGAMNGAKRYCLAKAVCLRMSAQTVAGLQTRYDLRRRQTTYMVSDY